MWVLLSLNLLASFNVDTGNYDAETGVDLAQPKAGTGTYESQAECEKQLMDIALSDSSMVLKRNEYEDRIEAFADSYQQTGPYRFYFKLICFEVRAS